MTMYQDFGQQAALVAQLQSMVRAAPGPSFTAAPAMSTSALSTLTGVDTTALEAALFGKDIPVFVGGQALMGCRIIEGPFLHVVSGVNVVDFIATCAVSANPGGTRTITSLNLNGTQSWTSAGGPIGTPFAGMTVNVKTGTEDQTPFASSVTRYGDFAVPYRSHICVEILNCPLDAFNNVVPFASIFVHEDFSITRNAALAVLAKYARFDPSEYEFNVAGSDTFWIVPQQTEFIAYMQNLRTIFRNWNITATDKLRVFDSLASGGITSTITRSNVTAGSLKLTRADPLSIPRQRILSFIDVDRDNEINTAPATLERFPVSVTASQQSQTVELPIGMTLSDALLDVNSSLLIDDLARKKMIFTGMNALNGSEPGDVVYFADDSAITFLGRVTSVARKAADFGTDITAEQIDFSSLPNVAPVITSNGGGSTAAITIAGSTTAVTTVTATDANHDLIRFSIVGGADAAKFTVNSSTGALAFLSAPVAGSYVVVVEASDGSLSDTQTITVNMFGFTMSGIGSAVFAGSPVSASFTMSGIGSAAFAGSPVIAIFSMSGIGSAAFGNTVSDDDWLLLFG
jgi:hypothetical protein